MESEKPKTVRLRIHADFPGKGMKGDVFTVPISRTGILRDLYWRRRLKDAESDGCVEILKEGTEAREAAAAAKVEAQEPAKNRKTEKATSEAETEKEGVSTNATN